MDDSASNSDSIEKNQKNKFSKKNKKRKNPVNESNSSSSSNYHPENHNYLLELLPYMSPDSEEKKRKKLKFQKKIIIMIKLNHYQI